jgi:hypothetical protein
MHISEIMLPIATHGHDPSFSRKEKLIGVIAGVT